MNGDLYRAAIHEAAHAVIGDWAGLGVESVWIDLDPKHPRTEARGVLKDAAGACVWATKGPAHPPALLLGILAGPAATAKLHGRTREYRAVLVSNRKPEKVKGAMGVLRDFLLAYRTANPARLYVGEAWDVALGLVEAYWPAIELVAQELLLGKVLDAARVQELVGCVMPAEILQ